MKVLIIEDERIAADRLAQLVLEYESHINILGKLDSVETAVAWLKNNPEPDLIFLDIQLADGLSFNIFDQVKISCPIIFCTAYDEYALRAFRLNSIDYLLKPVDFESIAQALDKFVSLFMQKKQQPQAYLDPEVLREMISQVQQPKRFKNRFIVRKGERLIAVPVEDILYFYSEDKATLFMTKEGRKFVVDYTLGELETQVDPLQFFRLNRAYLARAEAIQDIISYSQSRLKIVLKESKDPDILVSKKNVYAFKVWLEDGG